NIGSSIKERTVQIGIVGLGRMGANIARRLRRAGHECVVHDVNADVVKTLSQEGIAGAHSLSELAKKLQAPRHIWIMLPSGDVTQSAIDELAGLLARGDVIIDGGNTFYQDDIRRAAALSSRGVGYVDVGTSGGVWGLERGYCLMIGGKESDVQRL